MSKIQLRVPVFYKEQSAIRLLLHKKDITLENSSTIGHCYKLSNSSVKLLIHVSVFTNHICDTWHTLPDTSEEAISMNAFKWY